MIDLGSEKIELHRVTAFHLFRYYPDPVEVALADKELLIVDGFADHKGYPRHNEKDTYEYAAIRSVKISKIMSISIKNLC